MRLTLNIFTMGSGKGSGHKKNISVETEVGLYRQRKQVVYSATDDVLSISWNYSPMTSKPNRFTRMLRYPIADIKDTVNNA